LDRLLQRLAETRRLLVIGAHPDDEDTRLLTVLAQGLGVDAAYLSLTRGEGGQNLIGEELGVGLGLLRSRELEAARMVDGARQFVTRAYDFGYTRSVAETRALWPPDSILRDVVRVVRRFRPHVIVSTWSGTPRDRHGQHQMAGAVAHEAFDAAADPARFIDLRMEGLAPWRTLTLYRSTRFDAGATTLTLETGTLDPRTGLSHHQLAMASRSRHRSQDMGQLQTPGPNRTRLGLVRDRTNATDGQLFSGVPRDTSWLSRLADSLRSAVGPTRLADAVAPLSAALGRWRREGGDGARERLLERAVATAAGLVMDVRSSAETAAPGSALDVTVYLYNGGPHDVRIERLGVVSSGAFAEAGLDTVLHLAPAGEYTHTFRVDVPDGTPPTQPYFLERPRNGALYDWSEASPHDRAELFAAPPLEGRARLRVADGPPVRLAREATYRFNDQAVGEQRRPIRVVPPIDVALEPERVFWSTTGPDQREFTVSLTYHGVERVSGDVGLEVDGRPLVAGRRFAFERAGERLVFAFPVTREQIGGVGATVRAVARTADGGVFDRSSVVVDYPHVRPTAWVRPAEAAVRIAQITLPAVDVIGYVRGASDRVPEALLGIGLPVELLRAEALARGDLSRYDVIVVGSRAYETDSALVQHNSRLLEYVRAGGRLIVQYQQYQFSRGDYAPYPLAITFPSDRVTDERAPVRVLVPEHPTFSSPNRIGLQDWDGWPQERGLYFAGTWDTRYTPLLEMRDPGMDPVQGALLVTSYGAGTYVYTGISFFRSLPAGVPGAYRLFLNLLALELGDDR
jgi:LmbE family N-acetylglucosaminyl deacetylase